MKEIMEKVSIIIPFYNCPYIDLSIQSALNQSYPNKEVVVVNDGSNRYKEKILPYMDKIIYLEKENGGTGSALNAGIKKAEGTYITWLSSDDLYSADKVAKQVAFMKKRNAYISYTNFSLMNEEGKVYVSSAGVVISRKVDFLRNLKTSNHINGCTVMMRKEVIGSVGLFNEKLLYTQDYDFWLRAVQSYEFYFLNEPLVQYRVHEGMGSRKYPDFQTKEIEKIQHQYREVLNMMMEKEKRMKFTFPILSLNKGGAQRMLVDIANSLVDRGHDVTILMPKYSIKEYDVRAKILYANDTTLQWSDYPPSDIIVSNFYTTVDSAQQAFEKGRGLHFRLSLCYEPVFLPNQDVTFPSYFEAPYLLLLSKHQQELVHLLHGLKGQTIPIYVSPNFVDQELRAENKNLQISAIVRKPEGGDAWHRDQNYLFEQLYNVKHHYPDLQYNFICPPREFEHSPFLQELKKSNRFVVHTPQNDVELCSLYSQTDIFVASSIYEAAQLPGLEAMKCGAALATVYSGGNTEYGRHEETCLMSYRHENRLAADIIRLIEHPALRKEIALNGKQEAEKWTLTRSVDTFENICRTALEQR
ncbi:glycosyltransferase [Mesobacillus stamsii]|uniref:Glycosyltransferase involved in cell wall biosynthesis n=1 Tax=Mesobacillus stamsii TaxID=225347 RepID=A0ABU0FZ36_9BACI|nr:glycosyltransferase [Mesobacillus stamsii]MDQ0415202.1 glycosyltransferase involved in cell wall biosynthesis [Mesobacillus stamsii]